MFGFKRRARERAAHDAAVLAAVHAKLTGEIAEILTLAIAQPGSTLLDADRFTLNAAAMQKGIDAVLLQGADPYSPDLLQAERHTSAGAMLARAAWNMAVLANTLDNPQTRIDFYRVLRLPRDLASLRQKAEQGGRAAQFELAFALSQQTKVDQDAPNYEEAVKWWREAALRGDARAQFNLAYLYATGRWASKGGPRNSEENVKEALERRDVDAKNGKAEALKWLHVAAENGHAGAQYVLGQMYHGRAHAPKEQATSNEHALAVPDYVVTDGQALAEAVKWYQRAADGGHAGAQCSLSYIYGGHLGFKPDIPDPVACARWRRKAADQGVASAQAELGDMYAAGKGVPQNVAEAARWYRAAAEQRSLECWPAGEAESRLGYMYAVGEGAPRDFGEAAKLFHMSAERNRWHREGEHYVKDYDKSIHFWPAVGAEATAWFCESAEKGWELAQTAIERMGEEAPRRALEDSKRWPDLSILPEIGMGDLSDFPEVMGAFREAAEQGDAKAQLVLGLIELHKTEPKEWLQKAARQGVALAARLLGGMYEEGEGISRDHNLAEYYYRAAAEFGDAVAQYELGRALLHIEVPSAIRSKSDDPIASLLDGARKLSALEALIPPQKYVESADWYSKAAEQGHAQAQCQLAIRYAEGNGVPKDQARAATLFRSAAEQGYANAQYELAELYSCGTGVAKNRVEAERWYRKAAKQGHKLARDRLGGFDFAGDPLSQNGTEIVKWLESAAE